LVSQAKKKAKKVKPLVVGEGMMQRIVIGGSKKLVTVRVIHHSFDPFRPYS
jgi:predicted ribosome-associated RNA-binding protein Tma20